MKKQLIYLSILVMVLAAAGCEKEPKTALQYYGDYLTDYARLKVVNAAPSLRSFHVWVNNVKINGATANAPLAFGSLWPAQDYSAVPSGVGSVSVVYPATAARPDSVYRALASAMQPGSYYSLIVTDSVARPNKAVFVADDFGAMTDSGYYKLRFVNAIGNSTPLDVYSQRQGRVIASNIAYGSGTAFIKLPLAFVYTSTGTSTTDTFYLRRTGTGTNLAFVPPAPPAAAGIGSALSLTPSNQRAITIYARGNFLDSTSTTTTRRLLLSYTNF